MQTEREENLRKFQNGDIDVMVATDVASRGLDISGVSHVVKYDLPWSAEIYVQRIGRTGRIGHHGQATTFIGVDKFGVYHDRPEVLEALLKIMRDANNYAAVPDWLVAKVDELRTGSWAGDYGDRKRTDATQWEDWGKSASKAWTEPSTSTSAGAWTDSDASNANGAWVDPGANQWQAQAHDPNNGGSGGGGW